MSIAMMGGALVLAFIAYKVLAGMVKFAVMGALILGAAYVYTQGYFG